MSTAQITRAWVQVDGNHYAVCPVTIDAESQQQAVWLRFWRFLAARGIEPFPAVTLCPCGLSRCECVEDDPGKIAHQIPVT